MSTDIISISIPNPPQKLYEFVYYLVVKICDKPRESRWQKELVALASRLLIEREEAQAIAVAYSDDADDYCRLYAKYAFGKEETLREVVSVLMQLKIRVELTTQVKHTNTLLHYCGKIFPTNAFGLYSDTKIKIFLPPDYKPREGKRVVEELQ